MFSNNSALFLFVATVLSFLGHVSAHVGPWAKGMYCLNGPQTAVNLNSDAIVQPLFQLPFKDWWFHHVNQCDEFPPPAGEFLELPAGRSVMVELATNRAKTSLSYNGQYASEWLDGANYPENYSKSPGCITTPNIHTQNESMAAGTAFAISYTSDIKKVTPENLVVFSVRYKTPWKRVVYYDVPADMPACPEGGCICAWGWVPNGCGEPNMYHVPFKCKVTGATSNKVVGTPNPPKWCEDNTSACVTGPKQMIYWNQLEGNNIEVEGFDLHGQNRSPAYNNKLGFKDGAQNDIFVSTTTGGSSGSGSSPGSGSSFGSPGSGSSGTSSKPSGATPTHSQPESTTTALASTTTAPASQSTSSSRKCSAGKHTKRKTSASSHRRRHSRLLGRSLQHSS